VYQAFGGDGAKCPTGHQLREQVEDFVREGASGLVAFAGTLGGSMGGWTSSPALQDEITSIHREIVDTGGLEVAPEPEEMSRSRVQPVGFWERPRAIPGVIPAWHIIGPFDDPGEGHLSTKLPPEDRVDLEAVHQGKHGPVRWLRRTTQAGSVGLGEIMGDQRLTSNSIAYATCTVQSREDREAVLSLGSDDDIMVWLDGDEVWAHEGTRGIERDVDRVPVVLPEGRSSLLVKVCNRAGMWGFFARFTDRDGSALEGLEFSPG
jgi:hypothetical protein